MVNPTLLEPDQVLAGKYRIIRLRSQSLASYSYMALDSGTERSVLITCSQLRHLDDGPPKDEDFYRRLLSLKELAIDFAARVVEGGIDDEASAPGRLYWVACDHIEERITLADFLGGAPVVTEYLKNAREAIEENALSIRSALALAVSMHVSDILAKAAAKGIFHGGLDPRTVALQGNGIPMVFELGYQGLFGQMHFAPLHDDLDFRAPELRKGNRSDVRSDVFALGAIMFWMISGSSPVGVSPRSLIAQADPGKYGPTLPKLIEIIAQAMEPDPARRFQTFDEFKEAVHAASGPAISQLEREYETGADDIGRPNATSKAPISGARVRVASGDATPTPRVPLTPAKVDPERRSQPPGDKVGVDARSTADRVTSNPSNKPEASAGPSTPSSSSIAPQSSVPSRGEAKHDLERAGNAAPTVRVRRALWFALGAGSAIIGAIALRSPVAPALIATPTLRMVRPIFIFEREPITELQAPHDPSPFILVWTQDSAPLNGNVSTAKHAGSCLDWEDCDPPDPLHVDGKPRR